MSCELMKLPQTDILAANNSLPASLFEGKLSPWLEEIEMKNVTHRL